MLANQHANAATPDKKKISHKKKTIHSKKASAKNKPATTKPILSEDVHYLEWKEVQDFIEQMQTQYQFDKAQLSAIFAKTRYIDSVVQLIKPMPAGKPKNWKVYRARFVENARIGAGVAFWERNVETLNRAENLYGVPAEIIVGLIGVETIYGKNTGNFRAIDALTTLSFSYPETPNKEARMAFFKKELRELLLWTRESAIDVFDVKGSYAGALGLAQFMPSSLRQFAVDFDGDGKINLKESETDAIGSVAHYLAIHGWKKNVPYAFPASLSSEKIDEKQLAQVLGQGLKATYVIDELRPIVSTPDENAPRNIKYGLIDLQNGDNPTEYWLGTENFFAITQYNRSYFYAMSVIDLGKVISLARRKND
ncbi:lytic murein transglycosylase B [Undibacterium sp. Di24W]|uniref:lytic murein transglycosylase B n=1 Tax=Undibacterium sp. Di24W TaxID=3413033 RepID=UPI003BF4CFAD